MSWLPGDRLRLRRRLRLGRRLGAGLRLRQGLKGYALKTESELAVHEISMGQIMYEPAAYRTNHAGVKTRRGSRDLVR